ncbi:MAG: YkgJ family cysteine cluster protein [Candidatus Aureabacteria bacterium]|nr:YkgJ family cysteine cluster protein [Candidatus Auribacterota bacterium]
MDKVDFIELCKKCDDPCCNGYFILSEDERKKLCKAGHNRHIEERDDYCVFEGDPCPFYADGKCSIHDIRPTICRVYPMYPYINDDGKLEIDIDDECPAVKELGKEFFEQAREKAEKFVKEEISVESYRKFWSEY